jgi:hypothetical protein
MWLLEQREPASVVLQARLLGANEDHQVEVLCSVNFEHAAALCPPDERYRHIMLEGAQQAGMCTEQARTIMDEATPWTPPVPADERSTFPLKGAQRRYTRDEVRGCPFHVIFRSKVLYLDREDESAMHRRAGVFSTLSTLLSEDIWAGRDCTRFLQLQFYNPKYGAPPVARSLESEYHQWMEDMANRGFLAGYDQIGFLSVNETRSPPEEYPSFPWDVHEADRRPPRSAL